GRVIFPLLIAALATASCASTPPSIAGSTAENQQRNDNPSDNRPKEKDLNSNLKKLIGKWECTVGNLPSYWKGGSQRVLKIYDAGSKLSVYYGLSMDNVWQKRAEVISYSNTTMISFQSSASGRV